MPKSSQNSKKRQKYQILSKIGTICEGAPLQVKISSLTDAEKCQKVAKMAKNAQNTRSCQKLEPFVKVHP